MPPLGAPRFSSVANSATSHSVASLQWLGVRVALDARRVLRCRPFCVVGRFRFFFFSNEGNEPPHIHVKAGADEAKFWLQPVQLAANYGFNGRELNQIRRIVGEHSDEFVEAWNENFNQ